MGTGQASQVADECAAHPGGRLPAPKFRDRALPSVAFRAQGACQRGNARDRTYRYYYQRAPGGQDHQRGHGRGAGPVRGRGVARAAVADALKRQALSSSQFGRQGLTAQRG